MKNLCLPLIIILGLITAASSQTVPEKKEDAKPPRWDVNNPPGPQSNVRFDTDEGTWMNLDVSPAGDEIVFDLLGEIYSLPLAGGTARRLASGAAWDMQPRYSPDGKSIVFTSDRAGGDNIWIMNRDGSDPKQVTKEDFRLLNEPVWSPDGQYIAARKHFTSQRSIGAGEIWLYHRSGGQGLQLTKKPNDQKDAGEPAFSPDGRYVYFSQDTTSGPVFEYNKDPNAQIYVIQRFDRETGRTEPFVTGAGGSIRPTPSPDGKRLAFVRRVGLKSALFVQDVESGAESALYDGLDRDLQETWAIHGVYPAMAWTPDNRSIVFWAGGKLQRIDVASRKVTAIPFQADVDLQISAALRYPIAVAPSKFTTRMLRWVEVSPDGKSVVFQMLGRLYVRNLPEGTPRRLTSDAVSEYYPSFSRDGQWIVYTTFDDQELGSVRVVLARGGQSRAVTDRKGHYVEPVFSPDGKTIVYRRTGGGFLTSPQWSRDSGLYQAPAAGGPSHLVTRGGVGPHFGSSNGRVYFGASDGDKRVLKSIELDGSDERTHLSSEAVDEFHVSPDERWVAFTEFFNAYIAAFPPTGKAVDIGPKSQAIPVRQVSRDAGEYLHWSSDSRKLNWALGPELFSRDLKDVFQFVEGAPNKLPDPDERGLFIGIEVSSDVPAGKLALVGARIITMEGDQVIEDGAIVIDGNRIVDIGSRRQVAIPADAKTYDVAGKTILPGIIDVHAHLSQGSAEMVPEQNWSNYANLAFGVTTTHDPSNDNSTVFAASEMARAGTIVAPRIFSTGTVLYGATAPFKVTINSLEDARSHLRRMKAIGAFSVKSYNQPRRDQRQQLIAAARELEMMVVPEGGSLYQHNMAMIVDGHTGIEHAIPVAPIYKDALSLWSHSRTGYTPTLVVAYGGIWGENYWYQHTNVWENERLLSFVPRRIVDSRARRRMLIPEDDFNHIAAARVAKRLLDAGVSIQLGAHGQMQGLGAHWELWSFVQGGMTPLEALRSATISGARYLGLDGDIGSLRKGKLADLVVLDKNPLENIRNSETILYTVVNGRIFDARTMNQIGNHPKQREKFFFE